MVKVLFIRHGQSQSNAGEVCVDHKQVNLTPLGQQQAQQISEKIIRIPDLIVTTPYPRTLQTAEPTLRKFSSSRREIWPLQEFSGLSDVKRAENVHKDVYARDIQHEEYWKKNDPDYVDGEGAESFNFFVRRVQRVLLKLRDSKDDFVVVFSHGHVMRLLNFMLEEPVPEGKAMMSSFCDYIKRKPVENGEFLSLLIDENGIQKTPNCLAATSETIKVKQWISKP